jgi:hypothetical protein
MRNPACDSHFILETLEQSLIAGGLVGKKLQCDRLAEREVVGAVDLPHASFSQQSDDAVTAGK